MLYVWVQFACLSLMTIVIWLVQCYFYPQFLRVHPDSFLVHHSRYTKRITVVVAPVMTIELLSGVWLFVEFFSFHLPTILNLWLIILNAFAIAAIWLATMFIHVPQHDYLSNGWHEDTINALIRSNLFRTILYTLRWLMWLCVVILLCV